MTEAGTARLRYPLDGRRAWAMLLRFTDPFLILW